MLCNLGAGHAMGEAERDADAMHGFEAWATCQEEFEIELGLLPGDFLLEFCGPLVFDIVAAPVVGGAAFGDGKEPGRELVSIELVPALVQCQEYLTRKLFRNFTARDGAHAGAVDSGSVHTVQIVKLF